MLTPLMPPTLAGLYLPGQDQDPLPYLGACPIRANLHAEQTFLAVCLLHLFMLCSNLSCLHSARQQERVHLTWSVQECPTA